MKLSTLKGISLFAFSILFAQLGFAQENFIKGNIIKNNGENLSGLIDYRFWRENPDQIKFKSSEQSDASLFTPNDIKTFKVKGEIYESAIVETEVSPNDYDDLSLEKAPIIVMDTTFLQTLIKGEKSLYYYQNARGNVNFFIKKGDNFELLVYKKYTTSESGNKQLKENKKYLGQLVSYFEDSPQIQSDLTTLSYDKKSLTNLFQAYYKQTSSDIVFEKAIEKMRAEFGILAGISNTSLSFSSDNHAYLVNGEYKTSTNIATGVFLDLILPRNQGKWSINNELLFSSYNVTGKYDTFTNDDNYSNNELTFSYSYIKMNNLLRFKYPINNVFLYANGGISNGFFLNETNKRKEEGKLYGVSLNDERAAVEATRKHEMGFILGTGVKYKKFSLEVRYEQGGGMSNISNLSCKAKRYFCLLGYRF